MNEGELIDWICRQSNFSSRTIPVGPGDDCAVVMLGKEKLLVTTDQALDGVHFILADHGPKTAGYKAMARGLSDIAAMAGKPIAAVVSVALPDNFSEDDGQAIYAGLRQCADKFGCPVVGGDVGSWPGALSLTVTAMGRIAGRGKTIGPVLRSGAQVGDAICVTGLLGGAWHSRRHLEFTPRIAEASLLAANYNLHSMIDISDGLATDLHHICKASSVAARLVAADVPIHEDLRATSPDAQAALQAALGDGEDYEILFTLQADEAKQLCKDHPIEAGVTIVGQVLAGSGVVIIAPDGKTQDLQPIGWQHKTKR